MKKMYMFGAVLALAASAPVQGEAQSIKDILGGLAGSAA